MASSRIKLVAAILLICSSAQAQAPQAPPPIYPVDQDVWVMLVVALEELPMSALSHRRMQQIFANVQQEARAKAMRKPAPEPKTPQ